MSTPDPEPDADTETGFVIGEWVLSAIEALAFVSPDPLTPAKAREILALEAKSMEGVPRPSIHDVKRAFKMLRERWSVDVAETGAAQRGFRLVDVDGALCFRTAAENARFVRRLQMHKPPRLSRAALETLAVIAYRQPATKPQVEEVRGVDSAGALKALLDKKLIRVLGKADDIGRPLLYGTTKQFLELFHLHSLNDLPTLKELHELDSGSLPEPPPSGDEPKAAVVMDLFDPAKVGLVSEETERESVEALQALERALGEAKDVAQKASTLVKGMDVDEDAPPPQKDPA